ncbi:hypothetical protein GCM10010191_31690 [Actinomadura vinacea]|uniref:Uncharacterized protein n=1 Tax=Actinomadura vinacea TaxID=115336 RepID=A0ABP5W6G3_9ACTN
MEPRNEREAKLLEAVQRPGGRFADRRGRRLMVGAGAACLALLWAAAAVSWVLAPSDTAMIVTFVLTPISVLAGLSVRHTLVIGTRGTVGLPVHLLDERQREDRLRAQAVAQHATLLLLALTCFVFLQALPKSPEGDHVPSAAVAVLFVALLATVWALPLLIAAWRQTDPPAGDEDDEDLDVPARTA